MISALGEEGDIPAPLSGGMHLQWLRAVQEPSLSANGALFGALSPRGLGS